MTPYIRRVVTSMKATAGRGIEAHRARYSSLPLLSLSSEPRIALTTLRARNEVFQKTETLLQNSATSYQEM